MIRGRIFRMIRQQLKLQRLSLNSMMWEHNLKKGARISLFWITVLCRIREWLSGLGLSDDDWLLPSCPTGSYLQHLVYTCVSHAPYEGIHRHVYRCVCSALRVTIDNLYDIGDVASLV
jgi:hypothetical protein